MELTDERVALGEAVRGLLAEYSSRAAADSPTGYDQGLWARLCKEIGVAGLTVPEEYGGAGAGLPEAHVVLAELGRALTPSPMLGCLLATEALRRCGDADACRRLLPGICAGERIAALAWTPAAGGWDPDRVACTAEVADPADTADTATADTAASGDGQPRLTGEAHHVLDADAADTLLIAARSPAGIALYEVDADAAGVHRRPLDPLDLTRRLGAVRLDGAPGRRLGDRNPLPELRDIACAALAAEQVGAASRALELTVEYTKTRVQFGRPIGSFQALQHRLADLYVVVEAARSASYAATAALASGAADAPELAAAAKVTCSEALQAAAAEMVQMHGGIAITWEHDAHLYLRRAYASAQLFGAPREHVARLAATVVDG